MLSSRQENHIKRLKAEFSKSMEEKYRRGAAEHSNDLADLTPLELIDNAIEETIDQYVYLSTLREKALAASSPQERIDKALDIINQYSQIDGAHHKAWTIDQVVRALTEGEYDDFVGNHCAGEDGPDTYDWDKGIPP